MGGGDKGSSVARGNVQHITYNPQTEQHLPCSSVKKPFCVHSIEYQFGILLSLQKTVLINLMSKCREVPVNRVQSDVNCHGPYSCLTSKQDNITNLHVGVYLYALISIPIYNQ